MATNLPKIISKEQLEKFCPSYQKVILQLERSLEACGINTAVKLRSLKQKKAQQVLQWKKRTKYLKEFAKNYLMPGEYWLYLREAYEKANKNSRETYLKVNWKAYEHLFYDRKGGCLDNYEELKAKRLAILQFDYARMVKSGMYCGQETAFDISFPHRFLEECFKGYQRRCTSTLSREAVQKYQRMKDLYYKIKAAEDLHCSVEEWFELLCKAENHEFVCHNAEYRLGMNLADEKLWILYIEYLQKHDPKEMLKIYSKYCRVFLEDTVMKQKYKEAVAKYGPIIVSWSNPFEFETEKDEDVWDFDYTSEPEKQPLPPLAKSLFKNYYRTYQNQSFCFSKPIVAYIIERASPEVLQKLFFSCKYFFFKKPTPICRIFKANAWTTEFIGESLMVNPNDSAYPFLKNSWVSTSFNACSFKNYNYVSQLIPQIYQCDAKHIYIHAQNLTKKEFLFLIGHGKVEDLTMFVVTVTDEHGKKFEQLENLLALLPNIERFQIFPTMVNENTTNVLSKLKFNSKIHTFIVENIAGTPFDVNELVKFFTINRKKYFNSTLVFNEGFNPDFLKNLKSTLMEYQKATKNTEIVLNQEAMEDVI